MNRRTRLSSLILALAVVRVALPAHGACPVTFDFARGGYVHSEVNQVLVKNCDEPVFVVANVGIDVEEYVSGAGTAECTVHLLSPEAIGRVMKLGAPPLLIPKWQPFAEEHDGVEYVRPGRYRLRVQVTVVDPRVESARVRVWTSYSEVFEVKSGWRLDGARGRWPPCPSSPDASPR